MSPSLSTHWQRPSTLPNCVLVTGGAGFIGSNFLNALVPQFPEIAFVNLDKLSYAGNLGNLTAIDELPNYSFVQADIADRPALSAVFERYLPDWIFHFAAESHVDRSILDPGAFVMSNVLGTYHLLEEARERWTDVAGKVFHHVSTDEVFGSLGEEGLFTESTPYDPSSPYSASKAGSDHLVRAYGRTFGLPVRLTNCSNNYGPFQFPEKLIPLMVMNAQEGKPLPIYGQGMQVRDWLYVVDHCEAIWTVACSGKNGETYNVGGNNEKRNLDVVKTICACMAARSGVPEESLLSLIAYVTDRPGHDFRYAIDASKIKQELGWSPRESFETGIAKTVDWYLDNPQWVNDLKTGAYKNWVQQNYENR